jgi:ubiquinone/menaquinone biosynthesis C-methylase UbiE
MSSVSERSKSSADASQSMHGYYNEKLAALALKRVYDIAPQRIRRYLDAELVHVLEKTSPGDRLLDLGCGYGRTLHALCGRAEMVVGIDNSLPSLSLAAETLSAVSNCRLAAMDAVRLGFRDDTFDLVCCIQNGISAFHVDRRALVRESVRVAKPGSKVLFSSYSDAFWNARIAWFELQANEGLLGEIDWERTGKGTIICKDGFAATTVRAEEFRDLCRGLPVEVDIVEVDGSSLFCEIRKSARGPD